MIVSDKYVTAAAAAVDGNDIPKRKLITGQAKRVETDSANKENLTSGIELSARKHNNTLHKTTASIAKTPIIISTIENDNDKNNASTGTANKLNSNRNLLISDSCSAAASLSAMKIKAPLNTDLVANSSAHKL